MDSYWIQKARKYIVEHNAFSNVSEIYSADNGSVISAIVTIGLPSIFIEDGITDSGVKNKEEVRFIFTERFPLKAPKIFLRENFPRSFPHINPSKSSVYPCIYEGDISELLQQSEWMNGILNQLVDWLEKAASNDLLNYDQGWEPMRNDECSGYMIYDIDDILNAYVKESSARLIKKIYYEERDSIIVTDSLCNNEKKTAAHVLFIATKNAINEYLPNSIVNLCELYEYAKSIGIVDIKEIVERNDIRNIDEDKLFLILTVKRPANIIGSNINIEFLNFVIHKAPIRYKKKRKLKRVLPDCKVGMLTHISDRSAMLLKKLSGTHTKTDENKSITLIGCGSLGSKIGMHLARNGNGPFQCIDNDIFMPHNNARHALTLTWAQNKAELLSLSIFGISRVLATDVKGSAFTADYSKSRIIIDTTASLAVKSFLLATSGLPPIVSGGLYNQGQYGILLTENQSQTSLMTELWAYLYFQSLNCVDIRNALYSLQDDYARIGQSCSSQTMVVDDARISLMASMMSLIVQKILEIGLPMNGKVHLLKLDNDYSLSTNTLSVPEHIPIKSVSKKEWQVSLSKTVHEQMNELMMKKAPCETGGVLLGTVFLYAKKVVISGLLTAPPDSIEKPNLFMLGTEGLEKCIKRIENSTNGKVTYLGTWHSHPYGGSVSQTDTNTYKKLLFVRNYEPTICLIVTQEEVILV